MLRNQHILTYFNIKWGNRRWTCLTLCSYTIPSLTLLINAVTRNPQVYQPKFPCFLCMWEVTATRFCYNNVLMDESIQTTQQQLQGARRRG